MKKPILFALSTAMLASLFIAGCKTQEEVIVVKPNTNNLASVSTPSIDAQTQVPASSDPTDKVLVTTVPISAGPSENISTDPTVPPSAGPTANISMDPTAPPFAGPTADTGTPDYSIFSNCCFVGNSVFEGVHNYGVIKNGTWFTKVGLNILTVYNTPVVGGSVPIINELNKGNYAGVLLMFGQNECGWPDLSHFIVKYEKLLRDVWGKQPNAKIFIMGITPVSQKVSDKGKNGVTNPNINTINAGLQALAERTPNAYYVSVPQDFYDSSTGALKPDAASDGIHLTKTYMQIWADHICRVVSSSM